MLTANSKEKIKTDKRKFIMALILLLTTNIIMGAVLTSLSKASLREQIDQRMLDIANTAAYQLNGDELRDLKAEDKGTDKYNRALEILRSFQENIQLDYIYGIRAENDGTFTFTIDPTVDDPGEFGSPIETTEALKNAANGTPDVDKQAYSDSWGRFYSAYSPVFDSDGRVAGIVGVDFDADWYDGKLNSNRAIAAILTIISLIIGVILSFYIMLQNRKRIRRTLMNLSELDEQTKKLDSLIMNSSIKKLDFLPNSESEVLKTLASGESGKGHSIHDEYDEISTSIEGVYYKLNKYLNYIDREVYTDNMTGASNKAAYRRRVNSIGEKIKNGNAEFAIAYFDINEITSIYANFGYEAGDMVMYETAKILNEIFDRENVFHITGDEFIIILEGKACNDIESKISLFNEGLNKYNSEHENQNRISVGKGYVIYDKEKYSDYRRTFIVAKKRCDEDKAEYFKKKTEPSDATIR